MRFIVGTLAVSLCSSLYGQGQVNRAAAAANAAAANVAAGQQAAQSATLQALARRNAANRARVIQAYATTPPLNEYSRADQSVFKELIEKDIDSRNANIEGEYQKRMNEWTAARTQYLTSMRDWKPARSGFINIGSRGQLHERSIRVDQIVSKTEFLNLEHNWWLEVEDTSNLFDGDHLNTEGLIFEVVGQKQYDVLATRYKLQLNGTSPRTVRHIRVEAGGKPRPTFESPTPMPDDVPDDARAFQIDGEDVVCSYIKRLRVRNRKYDVFFAVKDSDRYKLAWAPFTKLSKEDQRWIGVEDRRRVEVEKNDKE